MEERHVAPHEFDAGKLLDHLLEDAAVVLFARHVAALDLRVEAVGRPVGTRVDQREGDVEA